jgi:hypothetical protein
MESNVVWSERFTLNLPSEISRDKSELDYLRRTNKEAWEAAPKPRLMPAKARKIRPIIIVQPVYVEWKAELLEIPITTPSEDECERDVHTPEDFRRDSGVGMEEDEEEEEIMVKDIERPNNPAEDCCQCRRDSGISMDDDEDEPLYRHQSLEQSCCCDDDGDDIVYFENNFSDNFDKGHPIIDNFDQHFDGELPIDEAMIGLAV